MACFPTDHAGRTGPLLGLGHRADADPAAHLPLGPAPGRGVNRRRAALAWAQSESSLLPCPSLRGWGRAETGWGQVHGRHPIRAGGGFHLLQYFWFLKAEENEVSRSSCGAAIAARIRSGAQPAKRSFSLANIRACSTLNLFTEIAFCSFPGDL